MTTSEAAQWLRVVVTNDDVPDGDVGPCAYVDCKKRATHVVLLEVARIEAHTWVCDTHLRELAES
jgi:hypothetical protein